PWQYVKAADTICAYIKCVEEKKAGNSEFANAKETLYHSLTQIDLPEVTVFMEEFLPSFSMTLDELSLL
ncbi:MAG: 5'-deoxynucleotidase, partial [Clostridiales bacterium]|nr:5'-deoxynucleotidase [Clostridiales bacterium]